MNNQRSYQAKVQNLAALKQKIDFINVKVQYDSLPWYRRLMKRKPADPYPDKSKEVLAHEASTLSARGRFVDGRKIDGTYARLDIAYQSESMLPLIMTTYFDGSAFWKTRSAFKKDGSTVEWGIDYPFSECGVTGRCPGALDNPEYASLYKDADYELEQFGRAIREVFQ